MFFKRHIKQGEEIGHVTLQMLSSATLTTKFNTVADFQPTEEFFIDGYVAGFVLNYVSLTIVFGLGAQNWSTTKKGECIKSALSVIDPFGCLMKILIGDMHVDKELQEKGSHDATTAIGIAFQKLKQDDPDPKYQEAKEIAADLQKYNKGSTYQDNLASAAVLVTLRQYIQKRWDEDAT